MSESASGALEKRGGGRPGWRRRAGRVVYLGRHLMLKGVFADLLLEGRKKTTIRLGRVVPKYREVIVHGHGRPLAKAEIASVKYKRVGELTEEDALRDGFSSLGALLRALREAYPSERVSDDDIVTIIELRVIQKLSELDYKHPYYGLNPVDVARIALRYLREELSEEDLRVLEVIAQEGSLRRAAMRLHGSIEARRAIRPLLRRLAKLLESRGVIGERAAES
ncbi:MAG: ASCH domain-containing protein [Acidilobaceae archaeon]